MGHDANLEESFGRQEAGQALPEPMPAHSVTLTALKINLLDGK